jgi:protein-disulfide isomerase
MKTRGQRLLLAVGLAAILVVVAILVSQGGSNDDEGEDATGGSAQFAGIEQDGTVIGDPGAELTVTEFADPQCPFCAEFAAEALPGVIDDYVRDGRVKLDLQVLAFLGPDSEALARLVGAASLQDRAWETADLLYDRQGEENSGYATQEFIAEAAADVPGLDAERALADRDSARVDAILAEAQELAGELGVESTPSFVAEGQGVGPRPLELASLDAEAFAAAIDPLLAGTDG